jgi:hypothetical protein
MSLLERVKEWLPFVGGGNEPIAYGEPQLTVEIFGFEATLERKNGMILTITDMKNKDRPQRPGSVDHFYEIKVIRTGENPEYPAGEPTVFRATRLLPGEMNWGSFGHNVFIPHDAQITNFKLVEEYDSGQRESRLSTQLPPHHAARLKVEFVNAGITHNISAGGWARKSDRESEAWKAATASPLSW